MSKMAELHARGVTDLHSYTCGRRDEREELVSVLQQERDNACDMGDTSMVELTTWLIDYLNNVPGLAEEFPG